MYNSISVLLGTLDFPPKNAEFPVYKNGARFCRVPASLYISATVIQNLQFSWVQNKEHVPSWQCAANHSYSVCRLPVCHSGVVISPPRPTHAWAASRARSVRSEKMLNAAPRHERKYVRRVKMCATRLEIDKMNMACHRFSFPHVSIVLRLARLLQAEYFIFRRRRKGSATLRISETSSERALCLFKCQKTAWWRCVA